MSGQRRLKHSLWVLAFLVTLLSFGTVSQAKSISYQALKYGTNQTSMASGYFVHPASVTVKNRRYFVTMRIKTAKNLSSFPVKVLSVNGGAPQNVRKVKDSKGNSNLYYSFSTKSLKKRINASLAINVPKVYKANHKISFKFSTAGLPSLGTTSAKVTAAADVKHHHQVKKIAPDKDAKQASKKDSNSSSSKKATSSSESSSSLPASSGESASESSTAPQKAQSNGHQLPILIGGIIVIVLVVGGGAFYIAGRKR